MSYRSTSWPVPSKASTLVCCVPSGSFTTAPTVVGTPTAAIAEVAAATVAGSWRAAGSSAPSPHTTRSAPGSLPRLRCASMLRCATRRSSSTGGHAWRGRERRSGRRRSSRLGPSMTATGSNTGARTASAAAVGEDDPVRPPPLPRHQDGDRRVHEHDDERDAPDGGDAAPAATASCSAPGDAERDPGEAAERPHPADPIHNGPGRRDRQRVDDRSVRATRPARRRRRTPRSPRRDRSDERGPGERSEQQRSNRGTPRTARARSTGRRAAPRPAEHDRRTSSSGTSPTKAIGHAPTGGNASDVHSPAAAAIPHPASSDGRPRGGFTSGAVAAEHLLLVRELAPVLHEEAALAHELGLLHRDDLRVDGLGAVVAHEVDRDDLLVLLDGLLGRSRSPPASRGCLGATPRRADRARGALSCPRAPQGVGSASSSSIGRSSSSSTRSSMSSGMGGSVLRSGPEVLRLGAQRAHPTPRSRERWGSLRAGQRRDPRDLWVRDAGAPRSLLSLLGPAPPPGRRRIAHGSQRPIDRSSGSAQKV